MSKVDLKTLMGIIIGFFVLAYIGLPGFVAVFGVDTDGIEATQTLTISGVIADGENVTIDAIPYQFDTANDSVTAGYVNVNTTGNTTAIYAADALKTAINANGTTSALVTASNPTTTTVLITADAVGKTANTYATTEDMTNGAWGDTTMTGGTAATSSGVSTIVTTVAGIIIAIVIILSLIATTGIRVFGK